MRVYDNSYVHLTEPFDHMPHVYVKLNAANRKYKNISEENFNQFHVLHVVNYSGVRSKSKAIEKYCYLDTHLRSSDFKLPQSG